jgi:ABC-type glycerol-3-phosphate transport system substrate-binding protein
VPELTKAVLDDFVARNPGRVTLDLGEEGAAADLTKVKTALAANTMPDLWMPWQVQAADLFSLGAIVDLHAALRTHKDWSKLKEEVNPLLLCGA